MYNQHHMYRTLVMLGIKCLQEINKKKLSKKHKCSSSNPSIRFNQLKMSYEQVGRGRM